MFPQRLVMICLGLSLILTACAQAPQTPPPPAPAESTSTAPLNPAPIPSLTPSPATQAELTLVPGTAFMQGVAYTSYQRDEYSSPDSDQTLSELIKPMGVNWISLLVTCFQDSLGSTQIQCADWVPTDADLNHVIQYAHSLGIRVMLKPHIDILNDSSHWRGEIDYGNDETAWNTWFKNYTDFITHYASLAQNANADYFVMGTELAGTTSRSDEWREVIRAVRSVYDGPLTYAANWDEAETISWWGALDAIGVDAYYPLTESSQPTLAQLKAAWAPIVASLGRLANQYERPIIFTEIGYRSIAATNRSPGDWQIYGQLDLQAQARCYQAVFEAMAGQTWWRGVFWWNWDTNPTQGGPTDADYTANDKPAEDILRANYGAAPRPAPTATPAAVEVGIQPLAIGHDAFMQGREDG